MAPSVNQKEVTKSNGASNNISRTPAYTTRASGSPTLDGRVQKKAPRVVINKPKVLATQGMDRWSDEKRQRLLDLRVQVEGWKGVGSVLGRTDQACRLEFNKMLNAKREEQGQWQQKAQACNESRRTRPPSKQPKTGGTVVVASFPTMFATGRSMTNGRTTAATRSHGMETRSNAVPADDHQAATSSSSSSTTTNNNNSNVAGPSGMSSSVSSISVDFPENFAISHERTDLSRGENRGRMARQDMGAVPETLNVTNMADMDLTVDLAYTLRYPALHPKKPHESRIFFREREAYETDERGQQWYLHSWGSYRKSGVKYSKADWNPCKGLSRRKVNEDLRRILEWAASCYSVCGHQPRLSFMTVSHTLGIHRKVQTDPRERHLHRKPKL